MDSEFRTLQKRLSDAEGCNTTYTSDNLIVHIKGCNVSVADGSKLFAKLKDKINTPTLIILACSVTEYFMKLTMCAILKLKEQYPGYKLFIVGCMNDDLAKKYSKYGIIIRKSEMWDLNKYL